MNREVIIRPEAKHDIRQAKEWYTERSAELDERFIHAVDRSLVSERPQAFPVDYQKFRRILLRRFPYSIFFVVTSDRTIVAAILHQSRGPEGLRQRTESL